MTSVNTQQVKLAWGPRVALGDLPDLLAPQTVKPFTPPPAGIDNLGITSTDTFMMSGKGEFKIDFSGYVRVARSEPSTGEWVNTEVYTNLIEMRMRGEAPEIGPIIVTLNPEFLSTGQIRTPFTDNSDQPAKACRMAVGALFDLPKLGMKLFNKEPIELTIDNVQSIPPAGNPGEGRIYRMLPLYSLADPEGKPAAYLTSLKFSMGGYLTQAQIRSGSSSS